MMLFVKLHAQNNDILQASQQQTELITCQLHKIYSSQNKLRIVQHRPECG